MTAVTDWIAAVGQLASAFATTAAIIVALRIAGRDNQRQLDAQTRHQAEQVTAWLTWERQNPTPSDQTPYLIPAVIQNASQQVIYDTIAHLVSVQGSFRRTAIGDKPERPNLRVLAGQVPPGTHQFDLGFLGRGMHLRFGVELAFRDAAGQCWLRRGNGRLEQIDKTPLELYDINPPVGWHSP
jgi:hypothetical protein